jgi:hypothetical protein
MEVLRQKFIIKDNLTELLGKTKKMMREMVLEEDGCVMVVR